MHGDPLHEAVPVIEPGAAHPAVAARDEAVSQDASSIPGHFLPITTERTASQPVPHVASIPITFPAVVMEPAEGGEDGFKPALPVAPTGRQVGALGRFTSLAVEPQEHEPSDQQGGGDEQNSRFDRLVSALEQAPEGSPLQEQLPAVIEELGLSQQMADAMTKQKGLSAPKEHIRSAPSNGRTGSWDAGRSPWFTGRWRTN